ncbi:MAG TPA: nicotinate-nucleotide--dimethylbenzimidazole phosphoribosyltransferase [Gemmataceae bacterium]|nr:nicotinate-nucleotide--dimethylbenzimidazole phosphoribosyltransferase [Gemmataceae bacterium]
MPNPISSLDPIWLERAAAYQARLTMPAGALGRLLEIGRQLCAIQETLKPCTDPAAVLVMAADHGIADEGVSAYPQEVTGQMVANFLHGGAAINVLARRQQAFVIVVDMGMKTALAAPPTASASRFVSQAIARGTANFVTEPAMTSTQALQAQDVGRRVVAEQLAGQGVRVVALGEMGIGNTTSASAIAAALTGLPAAAVTGRGTGLDDAGLRHKIAIIDRALARHFPNRHGPVEAAEVLAAVGGFEIAGLVGAAREAASRRMLIVLDGFISSVAGLLAARLEPAVRDYFIASHRSVELGHRVVLEVLDLVPLVDLGLRLGEGSGAVLTLNIIHSAADILRDMATFASAGVTGLPE